ncbi:MAG TPA: DUF305 domain-containing protein [Kaistia sp.]|nr:DUF305 domain-containing protein [Kaistia sp.]
MSKRLFLAFTTATLLLAAPALAQDAHHPAGDTPAAPSMPAPKPDAIPQPGISAAPIPAATSGMPGGMDCVTMMQSMMSGGMPMKNSDRMPMAGGAAIPMQGAMPVQCKGMMPGAVAAEEPASTKAFRIASDRMHLGMAIDYSGNADTDFVRGMLAHHRGAIELAEAELEYGKDPEIRKLAEGIIATQQAEVTKMRKWLLDHREDPK